MKRYSGFTSGTQKCVYCGKKTGDYDLVEECGIEIRVFSHIECRDNNITMDFKNALNIMKSAVRKFKK